MEKQPKQAVDLTGTHVQIAASVRGPWRMRLHIAGLLLRYAAHLLNPRVEGGTFSCRSSLKGDLPA